MSNQPNSPLPPPTIGSPSFATERKLKQEDFYFICGDIQIPRGAQRQHSHENRVIPRTCADKNRTIIQSVPGCVLIEVLINMVPSSAKFSDESKQNQFVKGKYEIWEDESRYLLRKCNIWRLIFIPNKNEIQDAGDFIEFSRFFTEKSAQDSRNQLLNTLGFGMWSGKTFKYAQQVTDYNKQASVQVHPDSYKLKSGNHIFCCRWFLNGLFYLQHHGTYIEESGKASVIHFFSIDWQQTFDIFWNSFSVAKIQENDLETFKGSSKDVILCWESEIRGISFHFDTIVQRAQQSLEITAASKPVYNPLYFNCEHCSTFWATNEAWCTQTECVYSDQAWYHKVLLGN